MRRSEYIGTTEPQNEIDWKPPTRRDDETSSIELTLSVDFSMKSRSTDCAVLFLYYTPTSVEVNTVKPSYWRLFNCCGYFSVIFFFYRLFPLPMKFDNFFSPSPVSSFPDTQRTVSNRTDSSYLCVKKKRIIIDYYHVVWYFRRGRNGE